MCNQPTSNPPRPKPAFVGIKNRPADAGDHPRTAIAYTGVKKRIDHRAIMRPRPARHVNITPRAFKILTGIMGSAVHRDSATTKSIKNGREAKIGQMMI
jgi:hypothetical protein